MWIDGWLLAVALRSRKDVVVGVLLVTPVMLNYAVSLSAGVGDLRYSESLLPLYIAGAVWFLSNAAVLSWAQMSGSRIGHTRHDVSRSAKNNRP